VITGQSVLNVEMNEWICRISLTVLIFIALVLEKAPVLLIYYKDFYFYIFQNIYIYITHQMVYIILTLPDQNIIEYHISIFILVSFHIKTVLRILEPRWFDVR